MSQIDGTGWYRLPAAANSRRWNGQQLDTVLSLLASAGEYVAMSSYLLSNGAVIAALEEAAGRGCRCYLLTAAEEQLRLDRANLTSEDRRSIDEHRLLLDRCQEFAMIRSGSGFHAKAVLIDGPRGAGLLSTSNLRDGALLGNDEILVELEPEELSELHQIMRWAFFVAAENEIVGPGHMNQVSPQPDVLLPQDAGILSRTTQGDGISPLAVARIRASAGPVVVASYSWSIDHPVVRAMGDAARRGGDVVALANPTVRSSLPAIRHLSDSGVKVLGREWLHAKAVWLPEEVLVCSSNFRTEQIVPSSLDIGVVLTGRRMHEVVSALSTWINSATHTFQSPVGL